MVVLGKDGGRQVPPGGRPGARLARVLFPVGEHKLINEPRPRISCAQAMLLRESVRFNLFFANSCTPTPHYMPHYMPRAHVPLSRLQMGVSADSNQKAFSATDITAFLARDPVVFHRNMVSEWSRDNVNHVVVAVDPAGGGASAFAIASMAQLGNGTVVVRARALTPNSQAARLQTSARKQWPSSRGLRVLGTTRSKSWGRERAARGSSGRV